MADRLPLRELADVNPESLGAGKASSFEFRYIDLASVSHGRIDWGATSIQQFGSAPSRARRLLRDGDVLFGTVRPSLRSHAALRSGPSVCVASTGFTVVRAREGVSDSSFLAHYLLSDICAREARRVEVGSNYPAVNESDVRRFGVPPFALVEQRRIGEVLDTLDDNIAAAERLAWKLVLARRAVLERLFADLASESVLGESLAGIDAGWSPLCQEHPPQGDEWGVLKVSAVTSGRFQPNESKTVPRLLGVRKDLVVHRGDVLMSRANGVASLVGVVCQVDELEGRQLTISDKTLRLRPHPSLDRSYLAIALSRDAVRRQVDRLLNGSTGQNNISQREILRLRLPVPEGDVQSHIVTAARLFDTRLQAERRRTTGLRALRRGITDDLLAGHVRVPV